MAAHSFSALDMAHRFIREHVKPGDFCIDATAGRGNDTAFLCSLVGEGGKVIAFDIQQEAVDSTNARLKEAGYAGIGRAILESHTCMDAYADPGSVKCIAFNFGWLPGGSHAVFTRPETSIEAIRKGLELLTPDGIMSLCIYYGRDTGFQERDALLEYLQTIDHKRFTVIVSQFANRPNCPPIPVFITKEC